MDLNRMKMLKHDSLWYPCGEVFNYKNIWSWITDRSILVVLPEPCDAQTVSEIDNLIEKASHIAGGGQLEGVHIKPIELPIDQCHLCGGDGLATNILCDCEGMVKECPECPGDGIIFVPISDQTCQHCLGTGKRWNHESMTIDGVNVAAKYINYLLPNGGKLQAKATNHAPGSNKDCLVWKLPDSGAFGMLMGLRS